MTVVCIAGMHRSGTSMVARMLNLCGIYLGDEKDLLPPAPDNPEGFWENQLFVLMNDEVLAKLGAAWDYLPMVLPGWENHPEMLPIRVRAAQVVQQFANHKNWAWKDPRNSHTFPFWRQLLPESKVLICLRNPLDVIRSLEKRNLSSPILGFNLWLKYNEQILSSVVPENRLITHYDSYFTDPRAELKRVLGFLKVNASDDQVEQAVNTVSRPLRRNRVMQTETDVMPPKEVIQLYESMCIQAGPIYQSLLPTDPLLSPAYVKYEKEYILNLDRDKLKARLIEQEWEIGWLNSQLDQIRKSTAWKLVQFFVSVREKLLPLGSRRNRVLHLAIQGFQFWRREGFRALLKTAHRKFMHRKDGNVKLLVGLGAARPVVTIVIPVFNASQLTIDCIDQIYGISTGISFEVIVVDNHSTDDTKRLLSMEQDKRSNLHYYLMADNLGFAGAVNFGVHKARGRYVVILNNDTLVAPWWLDKLVEPFGRDPMIGIVSPVTNYVGEGPQIDPDAVQIETKEIGAYAARIEDREYIYEPNRLVFFCVAIKKEVFDIVGDLDASYEKGNYEDDDYCMRVVTHGFRLAISRAAFVYHFGTMTFKKNKISHTETMEKNRKKFYQKAQNISTTLRPVRHLVSDVIASVVVRTQDRPELLKRALISLSNQTFERFEVVVVNDGGRDISETLKPFEKYFPLKYVHNPVPLGRSAALNIGVKNSTGSWVAFLDDDDIVYPWHLDALITGTKINTEAQIFYGNYNRSLFASSQDVYPLITVGTDPWGYDPLKLLVRNYLPIHTWLVARNCFEKKGYFLEEQTMLEDYEFILRISRSFRFHHINRTTCEYRFYLDGVNSMATQRGKTMDALKFIYDLYPVIDLRTANERKYELSSLEHQIRKIEELHSVLASNPEQETKIYLEIISLVTGM